MKFFSYLVLPGLFLLAAFFSPLPGQEPEASPGKPHEVETDMPGITFKIAMVKRLDAENVMMTIRVEAGASAPSVTYLGRAPQVPLKAIYSSGGLVPPNKPGTPNKPLAPRPPTALPPPIAQPPAQGDVVAPAPFSLMSAYVIDEASKAQFGTVPQNIAPGQPFYGPSQIITSLHPGSWFLMSVQFKLPVPPPNPDGTIPVQKVDVSLPQAKGPIKGVVVPAL